MPLKLRGIYIKSTIDPLFFDTLLEKAIKLDNSPRLETEFELDSIEEGWYDAGGFSDEIGQSNQVFNQNTGEYLKRYFNEQLDSMEMNEIFVSDTAHTKFEANVTDLGTFELNSIYRQMLSMGDSIPGNSSKVFRFKYKIKNVSLQIKHMIPKKYEKIIPSNIKVNYTLMVDFIDPYINIFSTKSKTLKLY